MDCASVLSWAIAKAIWGILVNSIGIAECIIALENARGTNYYPVPPSWPLGLYAALTASAPNENWKTACVFKYRAWLRPPRTLSSLAGFQSTVRWTDRPPLPYVPTIIMCANMDTSSYGLNLWHCWPKYTSLLHKFIAWGCFCHCDRKVAHMVTVTVITSILTLILKKKWLFQSLEILFRTKWLEKGCLWLQSHQLREPFWVPSFSLTLLELCLCS